MYKSLIFSRLEIKLFFYFSAIFFIAYSYELANFNLSIDDELVVYSDNSHFVDIGRWVHALVRSTLWPQPVVPGGPIIIFGLLISVSYVYILKGFNSNLRNVKLYHFAVYMAFILFPTWIAQLEFSGNIIQIAVGVLAISIASLLTTSFTSKVNLETFVKLAIASLLCSIGMGAYQSLILLFLVLSIGANLARNTTAYHFEAARFFQALIFLLLTAIFGLIFYFSISKFVMAISGLQPSPYAQQFFQLQIFLDRPMSVFRALLVDVYAIFYGFYNGFGYAGAVFLTSLLYSLFVCIKSIKVKIKFRLIILLALCSIVIIPGGFSLLAGGNLPLRTFFAAAGSICCLFLTAYKLTQSRQEKTVLTILSCLVALQGLYINSVVAARGWAAQQHDLLLANAISHEVVKANNGINSYPLPINLLGEKKFFSIYPLLPTITTGVSFFEWDRGNPDRMVKYMNLIGFDYYVLADPAEVSKLASNFNCMPTWPQNGSVRIVDGIALVKLSDDKSDPKR